LQGALLEIRNLVKEYGEISILDIPSFSIAKGFYLIQGENGAGKTTFLKILAGILPYRGDIILAPIGSEKLNRIAYRKAVNFAEAEPIYPDFLTGNDLLSFFERAKGPNFRSRELSNALGVPEYSGKTLKTYSSGMLKKLSLVLSWFGNPRLLLLDESLITLDKESIAIFLELLIKWFKEDEHLLILFSTHQVINFDESILSGIFKVENKTLNRI